MSAPFYTAIGLFGASLMLAAGVLALGRLLRPPPVAETPTELQSSALASSSQAPDLNGIARHSWHLVALGVLFQVVVVLLLVWGLAFRDLVQARAPALLAPITFVGILALGLARAWRAGMLDTGLADDAGDGTYRDRVP